MAEISLSSVGFFLVILGFLLAIVAVVALGLRSASGSGRTRGGGVVLIGPFPIVFGTDRESAKVLMILAIVLIALVFVFMLIPYILLAR